MGQNKHITSKQTKEKHKELYSIVCGHNSLIMAREGSGGGVVVFKLYLIYFLHSVSKIKSRETNSVPG